jgi:hypothetical protein
MIALLKWISRPTGTTTSYAFFIVRRMTRFSNALQNLLAINTQAAGPFT